MPEEWGSGSGSAGSPDLWLPAGWDAGWKNALANVATTPIFVNAIGDSILCGRGASAADASTAAGGGTSWFQKLRASLISKYGLYGDFWPATGLSTVGDAALAGTLPWSGALNGVAVTVGTGVGWTKCWWNGGGATAASHQQFSSRYACTSMDFIYCDYAAGTWKFVVDSGGSGSFNYSIDGGAVQGGTANTQITLTNVGNSTGANTVVRRVKITGLSNAVHTIDYGWQSAATVAIAEGACAYAGTAGVGFARMGYTGAFADDTYQATLPPDEFALWQGGLPQGNVPFATSPTGFGFPMQPHLGIIMIGINDCSSAKTLANYEQALWRWTQAIRRGRAADTGASIIFVIEYYPDATYSDVNASVSQVQAKLWSQWMRTVYEVASEERCAVVNLQSRWGGTPNGKGFLPNNDIHPTDAGHADIASALLGLGL